MFNRLKNNTLTTEDLDKVRVEESLVRILCIFVDCINVELPDEGHNFSHFIAIDGSSLSES